MNHSARDGPFRTGPDNPRNQNSFAMTLVRPVFGGGVALPVPLFAASGVLRAEAQMGTRVILSPGFVAAFGERWFPGLGGNLEEGEP
jgi:hypothetical protein